MSRTFPPAISPTLFPLALTALMIALAPAATAQTPRTISFQGVLADETGKFVSDGVHRLTIRLYDSPSAASAIYAETHDATVVRGVFNLIIGSQTPIPPALAFDRAYFLGVSVGTGAELVPRTPMTSVPYALRAAVADNLAAGAPVVRSINGRTGELTLQGGGGTTITQNGDVLTVSSSGGGGGGTGIQGVQNTDGTISVAGPNGPVATLGIADSALTGRKLASKSIASAHLADASVTQAKLAGGIALPPSGTASGDLSGSYPAPTIATGAVSAPKLADNAVTSTKIADNAVTTTELANDAVTSAKIANGTITGGDVSPVAALAIGSLATTGNVAVGSVIGAAKLSVQGNTAVAASTALDVMDNSGTTLFRVRDNGAIGINQPNPTAKLEIVAGAGTAIAIRSGIVTFSSVAVVAGPAVPIPVTATGVQITDDAVNLPVALIMPPGSPGQVLYISNDDANAVVGPFPIASGQTRMFVFVAGTWRLVT